MPCSKCRADFNLFTWKIKCGECEDKYCIKCLKRRDGILYCETCIILLKRPPDRLQLMELKPKDLQDYLNKHNISTHGLVEKHELVELLCNKHIPEKQKKGVDKLTANFAGSVPSLRPINDFLGNLESAINEQIPTRTNTGSQHPQSTKSTTHSPNTMPGAPSTSRCCGDDQHSQTASQKSQEFQQSPAKYPKLADFNNTDELQNLSSRDLKILLTVNRVDFKGCVEKTDLLEKAERLWIDDQEMRKENVEQLPVQDLCKLCMDAPLDCVLLECGHIATCINCGKQLAECPICRQYVIRVVRTFKA